MSQPRLSNVLRRRRCMLGRSPLVPTDWECGDLLGGELPVALLPHLSGSATLLIGQHNLSIASFA